MNKRAYKQVASTVNTSIGGFDTGTYFDKISVMNLGDGDLSVFLEPDPSPMIIIPTNTYLAFDDFRFRGQLTIQATTGSGGDCYIHVWQGPNV